ncbi:MAG: thioredoxin family protein [Bacteroidota bacterium]|nr:thioredoxin family protein [Bacteroidota bacterium]
MNLQIENVKEKFSTLNIQFTIFNLMRAVTSMKNIKVVVPLLFAFVLAGCSSPSPYVVKKDSDGTEIITGEFPESLLESEQTFPWFVSGYRGYQPDSSVIDTLRSNAANLHVLIFCGTWCPDTKHELPRFFKVANEAGISDSSITLYGVDRTKHSADGMTDRFGITNVPTFIFTLHDKEIGRIIERADESIEKDLAAMLAKARYLRYAKP